MTLSIIIVNYRGWDQLARCMDAVLALKESRILREIVVVDNHSNDGQLKPFSQEYPSVTFIENSGNKGFAHGNNLGALQTTGEYLLFLNPDTVVNDEAIVSMIELAEKHPGYHIISTQQVNEKGKKENPFGNFPAFTNLTGPLRTFFKPFELAETKKNACSRQQIIFPDWVSGSALMIRRETFNQLGGWDDDFWLYYEDIDLCKRVSSLGYRIALICDTAIKHQHGGQTRRDKRFIPWYKAEVLKSRHIYVSKHFKGTKACFIQLFLILHTLFFEQLLLAVSGILFFFVSKIRVHTKVYLILWQYYFLVLKNRNWKSGSFAAIKLKPTD